MLPDHYKTLTDEQLPETIRALNADPDPVAAAKIYLELLLHLYWQQKNIHAVTLLAHAGIDFALQQSDTFATTDPAKSLELRQSAKALTYNLASFCWPGWCEPGITLTAHEIQIGRQAADQHLAIVNQLEPNPQTTARALWLSAAYDLIARRFEKAADTFTKAAQLSAEANNAAEAALNHGYAKLAALLKAQHEYEQIKTQLGDQKDGGDFVTQLQTVESFFRPTPGPPSTGQ